MAITDSDVVCGEGRQMIFIEPESIANLDLTDMTRALYETVLSFHSA